MGQSLDHVIEMQVNDDVLVGRIVNRAAEVYGILRAPPASGSTVAGAMRADDNEDSLRIRLMAYYKQTSPLIGYYYAKGLLKGVDGLAEIDEVAAEIAGVLGLIQVERKNP
jgi:adenylate kinase